MKLFRRLSLLCLLVALAPVSGLAQEKKNDAPPGKRDLDTVLVDSRLRRLTTDLAISDDQKEKLRPIITDEVRQFRTMREDGNLNGPQLAQKLDEIRAANRPKIQAILTPEQFTKYEQLQAKPTGRSKGNANGKEKDNGNGKDKEKDKAK